MIDGTLVDVEKTLIDIDGSLSLFMKQVYVDYPPYELECMQLNSVEEMRKKMEKER